MAFVETNGIRMHYEEAGSGPMVVLLHGFPESWHSWRHQLPAIAAAGFRAIAPDLRGYGQTSRPEAVEAYDIFQCRIADSGAMWWDWCTRWERVRR